LHTPQSIMGVMPEKKYKALLRGRILWRQARPQRKNMKRLALLLGLCALMLGGGLPGHAQTPGAAAPIISGPPDVVVIVYQQPGGADQVGITYAHLIPHAQVLQDMKALTQATGWAISRTRIKDAAAPMHSQVGPMTGIAFEAPGVVQDSTHTFPVEALARAFHSYKRLNLVFIVGPQFQFQGSRAFANNDIKVALDQQGTTYTYQIEITNSNFGRLSLASSPASLPPGAGHRNPVAVFLGILGAAALIGLAVYFLTARLTPKAKIEDTDKEETETRLEAGMTGRGSER
jgi:hypothetical protein